VNAAAATMTIPQRLPAGLPVSLRDRRAARYPLQRVACRVEIVLNLYGGQPRRAQVPNSAAEGARAARRSGCRFEPYAA
jgi:hypothetical protein